MKILLTGANGFLGNNILQKLDKYEIIPITRNELDLCDTKAVDEFFTGKTFDVVLHCAIDGGNRLIKEDSSCIYQNVMMALNLHKNKKHFNKLIHFGSGAELDRSLDIQSYMNIFEQVPSDYYGLSKNVIARLFDNESNFHNLRIFNVFAENESTRRMIKTSVQNYINDQPIRIHQDKMMDFFYIDDFINVLDHFITGKCFYKEMDCVYQEKISLSQIGYLVNQLSDHKVPVIVESNIIGNSYTGNYSNYFDKLSLVGLKNGIKKVYESLL